MTEDPLYRDNEKAFAWVCQDGWTYSTTIDLHDFKAGRRLTFDPCLFVRKGRIQATLLKEIHTHTHTHRQVNSKDGRAPWQLRFEGIDTVANVTWNGRPLPGPPPRSMFLRYTYEVPRDFLSADGKNTLSVAIEPGA